MKVLIVTNMFPCPERPGYGSFVASQVRSLQAAGVETDVVVIEGHRSRLDYLRKVFEVRRRARTRDYDVVHAHFGLSALPALLQFRHPVVISYCGEDLLDRIKPGGRLRRRALGLALLQRQLCRFAAGVIVKSEAMLTYLPRGWRARALVLPNGVDFEMFRPIPRRSGPSRAAASACARTSPTCCSPTTRSAPARTSRCSSGRPRGCARADASSSPG